MKIADTSFNNVNNLGVKSCKSDPAVFTWYFDKKKKKISGILCTHVDDLFIWRKSVFHE